MGAEGVRARDLRRLHEELHAAPLREWRPCMRANMMVVTVLGKCGDCRLAFPARDEASASADGRGGSAMGLNLFKK